MREPPTPGEVRSRLQKLTFEQVLAPEYAARRALEAETDYRRGLVAINGSALLAIIGLLSARLPASAVHKGAWSFFFGLFAALVYWTLGETANIYAHWVYQARDRLKRVVENPNPHHAFVELADPQVNTDMDKTLAATPIVWTIMSVAVVFALASTVAFIRGCLIILRALPAA